MRDLRSDRAYVLKSVGMARIMGLCIVMTVTPHQGMGVQQIVIQNQGTLA